MIIEDLKKKCILEANMYSLRTSDDKPTSFVFICVFDKGIHGE